jgi:hypothetical protein
VTHRDRKLLDLAHRVNECTNCGRWSEQGCEPAHQNGQASGKGIGHKGDDWKHAALCHACHAWLDQGSGLDPTNTWLGVREDKSRMWHAAHHKTLGIYFNNGWIEVAA